jgi:flagellar protein FliO/FliZ
MKTSLLAPLLWLLLVLALIPLVLLLLKRSGLANRLAGHLGLPRAAAPLLVLRESLSVGPNQRVVAVEVGWGEQRQCLLLGVTAQQICTLHTQAMPAAPEPAPSARRGESMKHAGGSGALA